MLGIIRTRYTMDRIALPINLLILICCLRLVSVWNAACVGRGCYLSGWDCPLLGCLFQRIVCICATMVVYWIQGKPFSFWWCQQVFSLMSVMRMKNDANCQKPCSKVFSSSLCLGKAVNDNVWSPIAATFLLWSFMMIHSLNNCQYLLKCAFLKHFYLSNSPSLTLKLNF